MDKMEIGAGAALVGAGLFSIHAHYKDHAGSLSDARQALSSDLAAKQRLLDADVLTGGLVILAGGSLAYMTKSPAPLLLAIAGFVLIAGYYHGALNGPRVATSPDNPDTEMDTANDDNGQ